MGKRTISVVVPVYNVEKYLERCVRSILQQTYDDLEVILVNDGSKDGSGALCDRLAMEDERIRVVHKENGGLSSARNAGIDVATGRYISLIDGDDYIHSQMYESMLDILEKEEADIISCGFEMVQEQGICFEKTLEALVIDDYACYTGREIFWQLWERDNETVIQCNKLIRRELFDGCRYPIGRFHEDVFVIHQLLDKCKKTIYVDAKMYYYVQRQSSIMHMESYQGISHALEGYEQRIEFFRERNMFIESTKTIQTLFSYLTWKYELMLNGGTQEGREWLVCVYQEKYEKYLNDVDHTRAETVLYKTPEKYNMYLNREQWKKRILNGISRRLKYINKGE